MAVIVIGIFPSRDQVEGAIRTLRDSGFPANDVGLVLRGGLARTAEGRGQDVFAWVPNHRSATLPDVGNVLIAGSISDCARRQVPHEGQISLTDALVCMGIVRDHAEMYDLQIREGYNLVTVRTENRASEAESIMRRFGSIEVPGIRPPPSEERPPTPAVVGGPPSAATRDLSRVKQGFSVYTSDGRRIGVVQEASAECAHVVCCWDMYVPPSRVARVTEDRLELNVPEAELADFDWSTCRPSPRIEYEPGGPGYSGLPPQEHEPGLAAPDERPGE
jgi:hypothetical protein